MTDMIFRNRKYTLAWFFCITSAVGLFAGVLSGGEFVAITGLVIGLYNAGNVGEHMAKK